MPAGKLYKYTSLRVAIGGKSKLIREPSLKDVEEAIGLLEGGSVHFDWDNVIFVEQTNALFEDGTPWFKIDSDRRIKFWRDRPGMYVEYSDPKPGSLYALSGTSEEGRVRGYNGDWCTIPKKCIFHEIGVLQTIAKAFLERSDIPPNVVPWMESALDPEEEE